MSVKLAHVWVQAEGATPVRNAALLHGILGSAANWKGFAGRLVEAFPEWRILLCDLRGHGDSPAGQGPHTLDACAEDVVELVRSLDVDVEWLAGHSFGGKVAMSYSREARLGLRQTWVLDAPPGRRVRAKSDVLEQSAVDVIAALRKVPLPIKSRKELIDRLLELGMTRPIALWMTTNLKGGEAGFWWRFDLDAVEQMLAEFLETDLWPVLENPPPGVKIDLVRAERSAGWEAADLERFARLEARGQVHVHLLENAGHWVHVDNPNGLFEMLAPTLSSKS
jgi:pimeloyl-ACP methyl ester carboxylesterase